jgi:hypothetical protein
MGPSPRKVSRQEYCLLSNLPTYLTHFFTPSLFLLSSNSGFASVASVNVIIALYVVMAFREDKDEEKREPVPAVGVWAMQQTKERTD